MWKSMALREYVEYCLAKRTRKRGRTRDATRSKRPLLTAPRPFQAEERPHTSYIRLLGDLKGVVYFYPKVHQTNPHRLS